MTYQAEPTDRVSEPPAHPICWLALCTSTKTDGVVVTIATVVRSKTWFDARAQAMKLFGAEAHELTFVRGAADHVMHDGTRYTPNDTQEYALDFSPAPRTTKPKKKKKRT